MAGSINKVILVGNLGRDPEIRMTTAGQKIATFSLATSDIWKDKGGERQERTEWHRVVVFNSSLADIVERFLKKGSRVYIEGALQTRKYTDASGQEKYTTEVVLGNFRGELMLLDAKGSMETTTDSTGSGWDAPADNAGAGSVFDDEIPF